MVGKMSLHREIAFGVAGQDLLLLVPDVLPASVTSVNIHAYDADDATISTTATSPAIDSTSTTLSSAGGDGTSYPNQIVVASASGIIKGRTYKLTSTTGVSEWVVPIAISGTTLTLRHNLANAFPTSSTLRSTYLTAVIPDSWAASQNNLTDPGKRTGYRVRWTFVDSDGETRIAQTTASLVRYTTTNPVTPMGVDARFPGWIERLPTDYRADQGMALIDQAFEAVRLDLLQEGISDHAYRDPSSLAELVIHKTVEISAEVDMRYGGANEVALKSARDGYTERLARVVRQRAADVQSSTGGATPDGGKRLPIMVR